jgi:hypothetical protein
MERRRAFWQAVWGDDRGTVALLVLATVVFVVPFGSLVLLPWRTVLKRLRSLRTTSAA